MYTSQAIIHNRPDWQVTSYGNGLAYEFANRREGRSVFFQGDDAEAFRASFAALTEGRGPRLSYDDAFGCIWADYAECAEDWGIRP